MSFILALIGGLALVLIPRACVRALSEPDAEHESRWLLIGYGAVGVIAGLSSLVLILTGGMVWGLLGIALAVAILKLGRRLLPWRKDEPKVDYVVEGSLLEDAITPQAYAELQELAAQVEGRRDSGVPDRETPSA